MSDIFLLYNGQKKNIKTPETFNDLQSEFLKEFYEDKNKEFIYFYIDKGEEIDIEKCSNFSEIMNSIKSMEEPIIKIKRKEVALNLMVSEEKIEKDENNSDALDPVRSGQVFTKAKKEEKNEKIESNISETNINKTESSNVDIIIENTELTKSIVTNNSNSNQTKKINYETPKPDDSDSDSDDDDDDDDDNQTPTGDEKPKYRPNKNVQKVEKKDEKIEIKKENKENKEKCDSSTQKQPSQVISNSNSNTNTKSDKINQNKKSEETSIQSNTKKNENSDSIEELRKKLKELEKIKEKSVENTRSLAKKNLELSKDLKKEKEENKKLKNLLNGKNQSNGNEEELEKIKKEYESKMEESNKRIEEIENEKKNIENKYEEINKQFLEEKENNKKLNEECEKIKSQMNSDSEPKKKDDEEEKVQLIQKEDEEKNKLKNKIKDYKKELEQAKNTISKLKDEIKKLSNMNSKNANIQLTLSSDLKLSSEEQEINIAREHKKKSNNNRNDKNLHLSKIFFKKKVNNSNEESSSRNLKEEKIEEIKIKEDEMKNKIIEKSNLKINKIKLPLNICPNKIDNKMKEKPSLFEKENSKLKQTIEELKIEINKKNDIINNLSNSNNNQKVDIGNQKQLIKEICQKIIKEKSEALIKKELSTIEKSMNAKIENTTQNLKNNYKLKFNRFTNEMNQKFFGGKNNERPKHEVKPSDDDISLFKSNINIDSMPKDSINKFSYECINIYSLSSYIYQGTEEAKLSIIMKNNCDKVWPEGDTKLVLDNNSKIPIDDINLLPQKPEEQNTYEISIKNLSSYPPGEYSSYMLFKTGGAIFGDKLQIKIIVKPKKNDDDELLKYKDKISEFREMFGLSKTDFPDERLLEALKNHDFDYEQSFSSLYD